VDFSLTPAKSDKQFKRALELAAAETVRLERGEDGAVRARVKQLATRTERMMAPGEVAGCLQAGAR
jgi:hypothetical protein